MTTHKPRHAESKLHRKLVLFTVALERQLAHFPSCHKHAISQRLRNLNLDVYELVVEAQKSFHKKTPLGKLDKAHEKVRMLLWVAFEMSLFASNKGRIEESPAEADRKYLHLSAMWDEIGAMIGGWINKEFAQPASPEAPAREAA